MINDECETMLAEYEKIREEISNADEVILYGKTPVKSLIEHFLAFRGGTPARLYDKGKLENPATYNPEGKHIIILCGMMPKTRASMRREAEQIFPGSLCYDWMPLYFVWCTKVAGRDCSPTELAKTLCSQENAIPNMDSVITTWCNLACRECSNGIPYRNEKKYVDMESHMGNISRITTVMPISFCNIQGGEPLMDKRLPVWLRYHAKNPRIGCITVATNGTIVPDDATMEAMKNVGAIWRISNYGAVSRNIDALIKKAKTFGVPYDIYARAESWLVCGKLKRHNRAKEENKKISLSCMFGTRCLMLYEGVLHCCCRTLYADAVNLINPDVLANELNISKSFSKEDLIKLINGAELYRMCDYCDYPMNSTIPAEQM